MSTIRMGSSRTALGIAVAAIGVALATMGAQAQTAMEAGNLAANTAKAPKPVKRGAAKKAAKAAPAPAPAKARPTGTVELAAAISLSEGKSTLMRLPTPASRVSVGDAHIADVILLNPSEVYMLGKSIGSTNMILWNKANDATVVDISVGIDTTALQARYAHLFPTEKDIRITSAADTLILSGTVSDVVKADQILAVANVYVQRSIRSSQGGGKATGAGSGAAGAEGAISPKVVNMLSIAAPQQVMLEVKVAEVSKSLVDQLGVGMAASRTNGSWTWTFLSNLLTGNPSLGDVFNSKSGNFLTIDAQKRDGLIKVLAEPTIMAISGQEASFLAGGKIFIPVAQASNNGQTVITLEEKEFGVAVRFTPTVLEGGRINLKVAPEVSDLNKDGVGITATGVNASAVLPSFTTRRATTTVQLFDGQSFAIGGLIKNNVVNNIKAVPVLGEIPILGALFRSSDFQTDKTELVFIITPHLVKPLPQDFKLPTDSYIEPSRSQFFLQGKLEGKPPKEGQAPAQSAAPTGFDVK